MKTNRILISMAVISMLLVLLSVFGKGSISIMNIVTIILDILVIVINIKRE